MHVLPECGRGGCSPGFLSVLELQILPVIKVSFEIWSILHGSLSEMLGLSSVLSGMLLSWSMAKLKSPKVLFHC